MKIFVSDLSLLEARWKLISLKRKEVNFEEKQAYDERFLTGFSYMHDSNEFTIVNWYANKIAVEKAEEILALGHRDYMDCGIAGTAHANNAILITEDKELIKVLIQLNKIQKQRPVEYLRWHHFVGKHLK